MNRRPEPVDALLVVDVGNTRIGLGVWDADGVHDVERISATQSAGWRAALERAWAAMENTDSRAVVVASVAPDQTRRLLPHVTEVTGRDPFIVREDLALPMPLSVDRPEEVGVDRVCSAAAAYDRIAGTCAVASFGTAVTIDCVSRHGEFLGGTILPGLAMSCDVLHDRTALLPKVEPLEPQSPFGRNTNEAISGGVALGAVGALREIVERFATELSEWPHLVITGGDAPLIARLADFVDSVVPDLSLMGVALAYRRAAGQE
jgi:type III pantothenate kinase